MKRIKKIIALFAIFCLLFTGLPMLTDGLVSSAATKTKKIQLSGYLNASNKPFLKWNKVSKPLNGYAVFRNGKVLARYGKGTVSFIDDSVSDGQTYTYQIKTYKKAKKTKKVTKWYNKQKKQWQNTKPAKQFRGKKKTVKKKTYSYSYKNASNAVTISIVKTNEAAATPQPSTPTHDHIWSNWQVTTEPTTTSTGVKTRTCSCGATETQTIPKLTGYTYNIHLINEPYGNGGLTAIYLETNNPNEYSYELSVINANGTEDNLNIKQTYYGNTSTTSKYRDLDLSKIHGVIAICSPKCTKNCKIIVNEYAEDDSFKVVASKNVNIKNYNSEETAWMNSVINQVTTPEISNSEKMYAICAHILQNFTYTTNDGSNYITLITKVGQPYWIQKKTNSAESPAELVKFGSLLNYPLKNMYAEYPEGTPEWNQYHMFARSIEDGTDYWCCPALDTGTIDPSTIQMFDPDTFQFWGE